MDFELCADRGVATALERDNLSLNEGYKPVQTLKFLGYVLFKFANKRFQVLNLLNKQMWTSLMLWHQGICSQIALRHLQSISAVSAYCWTQVVRFGWHVSGGPRTSTKIQLQWLKCVLPDN